MVYGVWCMVYGVLWCMVYGVFCMVYGVWCHGEIWIAVSIMYLYTYAWCMVHGAWCMVFDSFTCNSDVEAEHFCGEFREFKTFDKHT